MDKYFIGVDVGTGSARAALVTGTGNVIKTSSKDIKTWNYQPDFYEQSSEDIWACCVYCIKDVVSDVKDKSCILGIGFDATCSLVVVDRDGNPLSVNSAGKSEQNIILWMDHRAANEAARINATKHEVLQYVGGNISLEMELPKVLWLKDNLKSTWSNVGKLFDLPDFLTWKATNNDVRSLCSAVCKWAYMYTKDKRGWCKDLLQNLDLGILLENNCEIIGKTFEAPGTPIAGGLCAEAARDMGLPCGIPVGVSIIDAHAGGLALSSCNAPGVDRSLESRLALICGTSTCHMAVTKEPVFSKGVWGPYFSAMIPNFWLNEGGQSATGKLIDHIIDTHPAAAEIKSKNTGLHIQEYLSNLLKEMAIARQLKSTALLTKNVHVWPDFHGNRSPFADPQSTGTIFGLTLNSDENNLAILYLATVQALCYGTYLIMETLENSGHQPFKSVLICGGLSKNPLFVQTQADVVQLPVVCPHETESVLLGASILGAMASGFEEAQSMSGQGSVVHPDEDVAEYHHKKMIVFRQMYANQRDFKSIMDAN